METRQQRVIGPDTAPPPELGLRTCVRMPVAANVMLRRSGQMNYRVSVHDISPHGCKLEFIDRPQLEEIVWVKFDGFGPLPSLVCWTGDFTAGVKFQQPLHPAVFDLLLQRIGPDNR